MVGGATVATAFGSGTTNYFSPVGGQQQQNASSTESVHQMSLPFAYTMTNLHVLTTTSQPGDGSMVCLVRKNGSTCGLTFTIAASAAAGNFADTVNTCSVAANDKVVIQCVNNSGAPAAAIQICDWTIVY